MTRHSRPLLITECVLLAIGTVLLATYSAALVDRLVMSRYALREFDKSAPVVSRDPGSLPIPNIGEEIVDFSLWSRKRILGFQESLSISIEPPVAAFEIERLNIQVPVFEGTEEVVLNRGIGWIPGTAPPGQSGNTGLAGHRDGFFRGLKDIVPGDLMRLATRESVATYTVDEIEIVTPDNVSVLAPRASPSLTLVTCYPFYFVGKAPQRFIVHAALKEQKDVN
jgi:sortase A